MQKIPKYAKDAISILEKNGFEAYFVGGCVRDIIMNVTPHDFDIASNALPEQIKTAFTGYDTLSFGEKHGTVTVIIDGNTMEITTFRVDGDYSDSRHPDSVSFSQSITEDLKRRDFTINAMAMNKNGEIIDPFGGRKDIENGIVKAVGNAEKRFAEDALRILRALRFASRLGFSIETKTSDAMHRLCQLLENISAERVRDEFTGIICGQYAESILRNYREIIAVFIPEIQACFGFEQHTPYHKYDVWEHTLHAIGSCVNRKFVKMTMFFHDIAKPDCFKPDSSGRGHFKGHAELGANKTADIMKRLKFPKRDISIITTLISHHSDSLDSRYELRKLVGDIGFERTLDLLDVQRADSMAKQNFCLKRLEKSNSQEKIVKEINENHECVCIKDLDINGKELADLGYDGPEIGRILSELLENVMKDTLENEHIALLNCAKLLKYQ